jgi:CheY-like chemotaxis protein
MALGTDHMEDARKEPISMHPQDHTTTLPPQDPGGSLMAMPQLLLVEDERIVARDLARRLTKLGYTVLAIVGSGREAVQHACDLRPDLVLMDVGLRGGMNGLEAAAQIRTQTTIPVIYLTGSDEGALCAYAGAAPPRFTIQKPVSDQALQQAIQGALATSKQDSP